MDGLTAIAMAASVAAIAYLTLLYTEHKTKTQTSAVKTMAAATTLNQQKQKAIVVSEIGKPVILQTDRAIPKPGPHQVLLKVAVAGLNPHDRKVRDMGIFVASLLPAPLANDVVGTVVQVGDAVTDLACGERVMAQAGIVAGCTQNGLQEYALADMVGGPTPAACRVPDCISDDEAATVPCNAVAPLVALFGVLQIPAPWTSEAATFDYTNTALLIVGGGSNCGRFAVQLAALAGIGRIIVVGGGKDELREFGATHVINRHADRDTIVSKIREIVGDDLVYAFDAVNPSEGQILALRALSSSKGGALARLDPAGQLDESQGGHKSAGYDVRNVFGVSHANPALARGFWARLSAYLEKGKIKPLKYTVVQGLDADVVNEILDRYRDGKPVIKTHIHI
ncbi:hypothetical protein DL767_010585 [Monosporascus sp. MG133]|nr:hypothetical protein DL767_010585 [Monosporascus sp. MG133]